MVALSALVHAILHPGGLGADALQLHRFLFYYLIAVWLVSDPKLSNAERPSFDHAYIHMAFFPLPAIYEQIQTHRWKGLARALGLCALALMILVSTLLA
jgi:hypothetical protein